MQLKASAKGSDGNFEVVRLKTSTYNLLRGKLQVAMLARYVESEKEAYWLLLRDVPAASQKRKSFSIHIPKENRLSTIDWSAIQSYIRGITDSKLAVPRDFDDGR